MRAGPWAVEAEGAVDVLYDEGKGEIVHYGLGASNLEFIVDEYRFHVNLFDDEGLRLPHARLNIVELDEEWFRIPGGSVWIDVKPGTYTYNAVCPGRRSQRGTFVIDAGTHETQLDLFLQELVDPGRIVFAVQGPEGEKTEDQLEVYFVNRTTGEEWRDWIWRDGEGRYAAEVPAGVYDLDVACGDDHEELFGCSISLTPFGRYRPFSVDGIEVTAGKSVTLERVLIRSDGNARRVRR